MTPRSIVVLSGGQDSSTTLAYAAGSTGVVACVHFQYGQRHAVERDSAQWWADRLAAPLVVLDVPAIGDAVSSALTSAGAVTDAHPNAPHLPASFVPGRNVVMLTLAAAVAHRLAAPNVWAGMSAVDYSGYPDCRPGTLRSTEQTIRLALDWPDCTLHLPLLDRSKADTFALAERLGVLDDVIEHTHTCYEGDHSTRHEWGYGCGACPACVIRRDGWREFRGGKVQS